MSVHADALEIGRVARTLAEVAHALASADRAADRIVAALGLLQQVVPCDTAALLEGVPRDGRCQLHTIPIRSPAEVDLLRVRLEDFMSLMGEDSQCAAANRANSHPRADAQAHLAIPVLGLNQAIGVLFIERDGPPYDENSLRLMTVLAAQFGSYLTTLRLREEELAHARELGIALQRLQQTDRMKDEFLAMLGHELRNPLGAINFALQVIDHGGEATDTSRYHKVIDRQIRHLSRIVDDLLDASRVRLGKIVIDRQPVDLNAVAERWMETFAPTDLFRSHDVKLSVPDAPVVVMGDAVRIEQIFSNILTNALKYTPAGGQIRASVESEDSQGVIRVRDNGIGMAPNVLATVFDLFTQADESLSRSQGGLGLGLPLVRSLVEKHGGTVEGSSDGPGKGSEFVVRLPLTSSTGPLAAKQADVTASPNMGPLRMLIVEDNDDARDTLKVMLELWGHSVDAAADGLQGVKAALLGQYDVVLVDIGLPKLDGYGVARKIREEFGSAGPAMLAMTGYGQPEDRRRALDSGFDVHLVKPVSMLELQERLRQVKPRRG